VPERRADDEAVIMALASRQHGVVARAQLLQAGVPADVVDRRLKSKRLRALHRGVYRVGPVLAPRAAEMAAVLACGGGAVVSHWSAARLRQLQLRRAISGPVEVSAPRGDHFRRPGIRFHRVRALQPDEVTELERIPVTTVARTLYDLAGVAERRELERLFADALSRALTTREEIVSLMTRYPVRSGISRLRAWLDDDAEPALTRSAAEERFLTLIRKAQLPRPAVNVTIAGHRVDFFWRAERLIVEIDGFAFHSSSASFESDRRRDAELTAAGLHVMRVTWRQLAHEPEALLIRLARALDRTGAS
jgi:very-short-patch-repair endonuclease